MVELEPKELIKADSETFWRYWLKTMPKDDRPVRVMPDRGKMFPAKQGKSKKAKDG